MPSVYVETSFFSQCVTIRTGPIDVGRRATSLNWWNTQTRAFELFISDEVIRELSSLEFPEVVRLPALAMLSGLESVALNEEVGAIAALLVQARVMPGPAVEGDAVHMAIAILYHMDYLLTWNQKHLANPNKRTHLAVFCARLNLPVPQIVTPDLLTAEEEP